MRTLAIRKSNHDEAGSALIMAIMVMLMVSVTGLALLFLTHTELTMSQRSTELKQAFYLAEAGQEAGRTALYLANGNDPFSDDLVNYAGPNHSFDLDPSSLSMTFDASGTPTAVTGAGDDLPLVGLTRLGEGWYAAFLSNDPAEDRSTTTDNNDLVMITSIATGRDRSTEVVQAIVQRWQVLPQLPPATITMIGPEPDFWGGTSDVHDFSGDDCGGSGMPGLNVPVLGLIGDEAVDSALDGIHKGDYDASTGTFDGPNYESGTYQGEDTFVDLTDSSDPILAASGFGGLADMWTDCEAMHQFVEDMRSVADVQCCNEPVCGTTTACTLPTTRYSNVIFVDGDYELNPPGGSGTLVVTGELRYDGRSSWRGMIYVFGAGDFVRKGSGNGIISGAVMVADIAGPDGIYGNEDDCTGGDEDGFRPAIVDYAGGGHGDTQYCSADIFSAWPNPPYRIVSFRQR